MSVKWSWTIALLPAALVSPEHGQLVWLVDRAAAALLTAAERR